VALRGAGTPKQEDDAGFELKRTIVGPMGAETAVGAAAFDARQHASGRFALSSRVLLINVDDGDAETAAEWAWGYLSRLLPCFLRRCQPSW
jgi:hypothetical protein